MDQIKVRLHQDAHRLVTKNIRVYSVGVLLPIYNLNNEYIFVFDNRKDAFWAWMQAYD